MEISPAEGIRFLIPSRQIPDNKVKGKRVYSTLYDFKLKLQGTSAPGYEILNLFCSPEKIDLFDTALSEKKPYYTITPKDEEQLRKLLDRLEHLQKQEWSGKSVTVWIVNPKSENFFSIASPGAIPSTLNKFFPPIGAAGTTGKQ